MSMKDYYKILEVSESAGQEEIKKSYRRLAKLHHPDTHHGDKQAEDRFKEISEAYQVLKDKQKRMKYDQMRKYGGGGFNFGNGGYQTNRVYTGFSFDLMENVKGTVYYLWQTSTSSGAKVDTDVLGTGFKILF